MSRRRPGWAAPTFSAVARPRMPPPMIVRSYWEAIEGSKFKVQSSRSKTSSCVERGTLNFERLNVKQPARVFSGKTFYVLGIGLRRDRVECLFEWAQAAAIIRTEDDVILAHLGD